MNCRALCMSIASVIWISLSASSGAVDMKTWQQQLQAQSAAATRTPQQRPQQQASFTHEANVEPDSRVGASIVNSPQVYAVNVTNTGQTNLFCTANARAMVYNQNAVCTGEGDQGCQNITQWFTNSGNSYVSPGNTQRVVGISFYAGQGSYTVNCKAQ